MGNWTKFIRTDGQTPDARSLVTLRPTEFAFNSHFIRINKLQEYPRITIYCDASQYRVGLKFHSDTTDQNSFALTSGGKGSDSRRVGVRALMKQHLWLSVAAKLPSQSVRRYKPNWLPADGLWVLNIRPSFEIHVTSKTSIEHGLSGIYRYKIGDQIVYIGRGEIRSRANCQERAEWNIDSIEYSIISDPTEQEKWETLWLDEYRNEFGTLPLYNRIGGKRIIEENEKT